jgi:hypothetical protein
MIRPAGGLPFAFALLLANPLNITLWFLSEAPQFTGTMTITWRLFNGTLVAGVADHVPSGIPRRAQLVLSRDDDVKDEIDRVAARYGVPVCARRGSQSEPWSGPMHKRHLPQRPSHEPRAERIPSDASSVRITQASLVLATAAGSGSGADQALGVVAASMPAGPLSDLLE